MIYIDASRLVTTNERTGVENYSYFLINEIVRQAGSNITLISPHKINLPVKQIVIPFPRLWTQIRLSLEVLRNKKIDNLFIPSHVMPIVHPKRTAITIHDVAFKRFPQSYGFLSRLYLDWGAKFAVKHAKNIIVPSKTTKDDLIKLYKCDSKKITVIPLGFERKKIPQTLPIPKKYQLTPKNYFLYVGRIETKKNTDTLIRAFEKFSKNNDKIKLVLAGFPGRGGKKIIANIPKSLKKRIELTGYVSEEDKNALFKNALAFVFPSRYEGFGIPILEAMEYELPIIASDIPATREILDDNAFYFNTESAEKLTENLKKICYNSERIKNMIGAYKNILQKYSWAKVAQETISVLKYLRKI